MKTKLRLTSEERREEMLKVARRVFAERGFHGTTTRELADEAGVSEALLFKYFPNKDAIYKAMLASCQKSPTGEEIRKILALKPSTNTLILMVSHIFAKHITNTGESCDVARLLMRSLCEDGSFARVIMEHIGQTWVEKLSDCIRAADRAGDLDVPVENSRALAWLGQHLTLSFLFMRMPESQVLEYGADSVELLENTVVFFLRGIGMKESAIRRHYDPAALAILLA